jgi:hypothetical protein
LIQVGWRSAPAPGRDDARRGRNDLEPCRRDNGAPVRRWRASEVFLPETGQSLNRVVTGIDGPDARDAAVVHVVTAVPRGREGIAPRLADQRSAGSGGKQQYDGQDGCAEHDQLSRAAEQERSQFGKRRIYARIADRTSPRTPIPWKPRPFHACAGEIPGKSLSVIVRAGASLNVCGDPHSAEVVGKPVRETGCKRRFPVEEGYGRGRTLP